MFLCHRGISNYYPENTLGSIIETFNNEKYSGIEIDIMLTKDKKWVVFHDEDLRRMCNVNKKVNEINFNELPNIKWKDNFFSINLLSDLIKVSFDRPFTINLEIKNKFIDTDEKDRKNLINIIDLIKTNKFLSSFDHSWFQWIDSNTKYEFACISETILPKEGNFWILHHSLFENIDIIDIIENNVKIGSYGKKFNNDPLNDACPLAYQIIDSREEKNVYISGFFDIINLDLLKIFTEFKKLGDRLIVGILEDNMFYEPTFTISERKELIEGLKIVDQVLISPNELSREFVQQNNIDILIKNKYLSDKNYYNQVIEMNLMAEIL